MDQKLVNELLRAAKARLRRPNAAETHNALLWAIEAIDPEWELWGDDDVEDNED